MSDHPEPSLPEPRELGLIIQFFIDCPPLYLSPHKAATNLQVTADPFAARQFSSEAEARQKLAVIGAGRVMRLLETGDLESLDKAGDLWGSEEDCDDTEAPF